MKKINVVVGLILLTLLVMGCSKEIEIEEEGMVFWRKEVVEQELPVAKLFTGRGDTVTNSFYLRKGFYKITGEYKGDSNFIVYLVDTAGNKNLIFNQVDDYNGVKGETVRYSGQYRLSVRAQGYDSAGSWSIKLER